VLPVKYEYDPSYFLNKNQNADNVQNYYSYIDIPTLQLYKITHCFENKFFRLVFKVPRISITLKAFVLKIPLS
jgi:hypothetical protein